MNLTTAALLSLFLIGGMDLVNPHLARANGGLLVSAASSLKDVLTEIKFLYQKKNPILPQLVFNFGGSGALLRQIEQGAPVDIFISAANTQMDRLDKKGVLVPNSRIFLASNRLALIAVRESAIVFSFESLTQPNVKRISMGEPRIVPSGQYGEEVLRHLNLLEAVRSKLVYGNSVRQVLQSVESGNADAGFVYITDAKISTKVRVVTIAPETLHSPIIYSIGVLKNSKRISSAQAFVRYLSSGEAKFILRKYGFTVP